MFPAGCLPFQILCRELVGSNSLPPLQLVPFRAFPFEGWMRGGKFPPDKVLTACPCLMAIMPARQSIWVLHLGIMRQSTPGFLRGVSAQRLWVRGCLLTHQLAEGVFILSTGVWVDKCGSAPHVLTLAKGAAATLVGGRGRELLPCQWQKHKKESRNTEGPFVLGFKLKNYPFFFWGLGQTKLYAQVQVANASHSPHPHKGVETEGAKI